MSVNKQPDDSYLPDKPKENSLRKWFYVAGFRWLLGVATLIIFILFIYGLTLQDASARTNIFLGILTVISLVILTISTFSTRQMVDIMDRQEFEMTEQRKAMREGLDKTQAMLEQTERHFQVSERPIFVIDSVKAVVNPDASINPVFVNVANKGRSAAVNVSLAFCILRPPDPVKFDMHGAAYITLPILAAQDTEECIVESERERGSRPLTQPDYDAVVANNKSIYIYGEGAYEDLSGNQYVLDKWAFRFTTAYGFVKDTFIIGLVASFDRAIVDIHDERTKKKEDAN